MPAGGKFCCLGTERIGFTFAVVMDVLLGLSDMPKVLELAGRLAAP